MKSVQTKSIKREIIDSVAQRMLVLDDAKFKQH